MPLRVTYAVGALLFACLAFQLFFRFQYVGNGRGAVWRVDRLTGRSCVVQWCDYYWALGPPPPSFVPDTTPSPSTSASDWRTVSPLPSPSEGGGFQSSPPKETTQRPTPFSLSARQRAVSLLPRLRDVQPESATRVFRGYGFKLLKSNHDFAFAYEKLLASSADESLGIAPGLRLDKATEGPSEIVETPHGRLAFYFACVLHDCGVYGWYVYDLESAQMSMWLYDDGTARWIGSPSNPDAEAVIIAMLGRSPLDAFPIPISQLKLVKARVLEIEP